MISPQTHARVEALLAQAEHSPADLPDAIAVLVSLKEGYLQCGFIDAYFDLLRTAENLAGCHILLHGYPADAPYCAAHLEVLLELMQIEVFASDNENYLTLADRASQLTRIRSWIEVAEGVVDDLRRHGDQPEDVAFADEMDRRYRHERYLNDLALARTRGESPVEPIRALEELASEYERAENLPGAATALGGVVEELLHRCRVSDEAVDQNGTWLRRAADREAAILAANNYPDGARYVELAKGLAQAYRILGHRASASDWFARGFAHLMQLISGLQDPVSRSIHLRDSDDWLGLSIQLEGFPDGRPGPRFCQVLRSLQPELPPDPTQVQFDTLRAHISRLGSVLQYRHSASSRSHIAGDAHDLFVSLNGLYMAASEDLRVHRETKGVPDDTGWIAAFGDLGRRLRLRDLSGSGLDRWNPAELLVETHGAGLHIPWSGLLLDAGCQARSMLVRNLRDGHRQRLRLPSNANPTLVLNCFSPGERLHDRFNFLSAELAPTGMPYLRHVCRDRQDFVDTLSAAEYKLVVIGCHGLQKRVTEPLLISVGGVLVPVGQLWEDAQLRVSSTLVLFSCYGGGGLSLATGEFGSQSEMALDAGARAVVASRWPAWMDDRTFARFTELILSLARMDAAAGVWEVGRRGVTFADNMRRFSIRDWATWSVHTSGCWTGLP